jgi:ribosomal protein S18 acetylase RimI-like enzyme
MAWHRVPYHRTAHRVPEPLATSVGWRPFDEEADVDLVGAALAASPNMWDSAAVAAYGPAGAAVRLINAVPPHRPHQWEVAVHHGSDAGFILPVVYATGGEGTVWHIGVLSMHRGHGLGRALLRRGTSALVAAGVTAVTCDVDVANASMIHLFDSEGWQRGDEYERELVV